MFNKGVSAKYISVYIARVVVCLLLLLTHGMVMASGVCVDGYHDINSKNEAKDKNNTDSTLDKSCVADNEEVDSNKKDLNYKPRIPYLGPSASFRKDELTGKASWEEGHPWSLKRFFDTPDWMSAVLEQRVRYESYATPWIKGTTQGQYGVPIQSVAWFKFNVNDDVRFELQFWDARQYG